MVTLPSRMAGNTICAQAISDGSSTLLHGKHTHVYNAATLERTQTHTRAMLVLQDDAHIKHDQQAVAS